MDNTTETIKPEDFVKLRFVENPSLSADGKLVFTIRSINEKKNSYQGGLYLKNKGNNDYYRFTSGTHLDTSAKFAPSGKLLAFLSSRAETGMQVFIMSVAGGEAFQVTNFPKGVLNYTWSHDSCSIHVLARVNSKELELLRKPRKKSSLVLNPVVFEVDKIKDATMKSLSIDPRVIKDGYYREGTQFLEGRKSQPFVVSIGNFNRDKKPSPISEVVHVGNIAYHYTLGTFSYDNSEIILSKYIDDPSVTLNHDIMSIKIDDPEDKKIYGSAFGWISNFQLSPNGKKVLYEAKREDKSVFDDQQIFLCSLDNSEDNSINCLTEKFHRSASMASWLNDEKILFLSPINGRSSIHQIAINKKLVEELIGGDRNINSYSFARSTGDIAFEVSHYSFPSDLFLTNLNNPVEVRITEVNSNYLNKHPCAKLEPYTFQQNGITLQGWLLYPPKTTIDDRIPVIVEIHGGPAAMWSPHEKSMWHEWNSLVGRGFGVVFCNPRGSEGYGIEFRKAVFENWGTIAQNDILKGLDTALNTFPFLNSEQVSLTGGSYGGYMTAWLITQTNRFKAAVSQRGVYEFIGFGLTTDIPMWFERHYGEILEQFSRNWADTPIAHVKNISTPLLIIHSENDFRVPIVSAEQLFWLGKRYGKVMEFIRYPRDGHELSRSGEPRHIIDRIERIIQWIEKYTK